MAKHAFCAVGCFDKATSEGTDSNPANARLAFWLSCSTAQGRAPCVTAYVKREGRKKQNLRGRTKVPVASSSSGRAAHRFESHRDSTGCFTRENSAEEYRGACVYRCVVWVCVSLGRHILGLSDSSSALSARLA